MLTAFVLARFPVEPDIWHCGRAYGAGLTAADCQTALDAKQLPGGDSQHHYIERTPGPRLTAIREGTSPIQLLTTYRKSLPWITILISL